VRIFELSCANGTSFRVLRSMLQHVTKVALIDVVLVLVVLENSVYVYTCIVYSSDPKLILCVAKIQNM
jgi:hypothetical protein